MKISALLYNIYLDDNEYRHVKNMFMPKTNKCAVIVFEKKSEITRALKFHYTVRLIVRRYFLRPTTTLLPV